MIVELSNGVLGCVRSRYHGSSWKLVFVKRKPDRLAMVYDLSLDNGVTVDDMTYRTDLGPDRHPVDSIEVTQNKKSEQVLGKNHDPHR